MKSPTVRWCACGVAWLCAGSAAMAQVSGYCPPQELLATAGAANDWYGMGIALDGDTLLVASPGCSVGGVVDCGAVFVYRSIDGAWEYEAMLVAPDAAASDYSARWPCLDGDTAFLGVSQDDIDGRGDQGSVNVFVRNGSVWTHQGKIVAADGAAGDNFGWKVQKSGDTLAVSAFRDDDRGGDSGSVYVFVRSGDQWEQQAKLTASDGAGGDHFGNGLALQGDTLLVGADKDDSSRGSLYVFERSGTTWTQTQKLRPPDAAAGDQFGMTITIDGDTAVVGAVWDDGQMGSATVYTRDGSTWSQQVKLTAPDSYYGARFGICVALCGDTLAVGAAWSRGDVYLYQRAGEAWMLRSKITSDQSWSDFGGYIAMDASTLAVGARSYDVGGQSDQGAAWVYHTRGELGGVDLNSDGRNDFFDVQLFLNWYSDAAPGADFNQDGTIDFFDVQAFLDQWHDPCG